MSWNRWLGIAACIVLMMACMMHWTFYPDIKEYFTGFYSKNNYYGRPGILLSFFAATGIWFYTLKKEWSDRLNMIFSAIAVAYSITSFLRFTSGYDGFLPEKQIGVFLMLICAFVHMVVAFLLMSVVKTRVPVAESTNETVLEP